MYVYVACSKRRKEWSKCASCTVCLLVCLSIVYAPYVVWIRKAIGALSTDYIGIRYKYMLLLLCIGDASIKSELESIWLFHETYSWFNDDLYLMSSPCRFPLAKRRLFKANMQTRFVCWKAKCLPFFLIFAFDSIWAVSLLFHSSLKIVHTCYTKNDRIRWRAKYVYK